MGILAWIVVGLIGGVIAQVLVPGDDPGSRGPMGIVVTIVLGIVGALLGGFLAVAMGIGNGVDNFDIGTIILSIAGAVLILVGYNALTRNGGLRTSAHCSPFSAGTQCDAQPISQVLRALIPSSCSRPTPPDESPPQQALPHASVHAHNT